MMQRHYDDGDDDNSEDDNGNENTQVQEQQMNLPSKQRIAPPAEPALPDAPHPRPVHHNRVVPSSQEHGPALLNAPPKVPPKRRQQSLLKWSESQHKQAL